MRRHLATFLAALLVLALLPAGVRAVLPDASADPVTTLEDGATTVVLSAVDPDGGTIDHFTITADPAKGSAGTPSTPDCATAPPACTATVTYTPAPDANGADSFQFTATDSGDETSATGTAEITITPVNDAPDFAAGGSETVAEDSGARTVPGWATGITSGPADESGQVLTFSATPSDPSLFAAAPAIDGTTGTLTYTPDADANGTTTVEVSLQDDGGVENGGDDTSLTRSFTITITPANDNPTANSDSATVAEDSGTSTVDVLANDSIAPDTGETLTVTAVGAASHGTTSVAPGDGAVTYTPVANWNGADAFTYTISDGNGGADTASVAITVSSANDLPTANDDATTIAEDAGDTTIDVLANDSIVPDTGETLVVSGVGVAGKGTAAVPVGGASVTYTPNANANGADSFTYTVADGNGGTDTATVSITITPVNDPPTANPDTLVVAEDSGNTQVNPIANDSAAPDTGESVSFVGFGQPAHGTVSTHPIQGLRYQPAANYNGPDSFTYTISDGTLTSIGTVSITVTPVNDNPVATPDSVTVAEDSGTTTVDVLGNDTMGPDSGEVLGVSGVGAAGKGTVAVLANGTGVTYAPNANANGADSFSYTISDGAGGTANATVSVTITPVNDDPTATDDILAILEDAPATTVNVLANDSIAPDTGETLTVTAVGAASHGTTTVAPGNGAVTYTPEADWNGADAFTYTIGDGNGGSDTATVSITVTSVNDLPSFTKGANQAVLEDAAAQSIAGWATAISPGPADEAGQALTFEIASNTNPSLFSAGPAVAANGTLTFTLAPDANGVATIEVRLSDGIGTSATQSFSVTVSAVNDPPTFTKGANQAVLEDAGPQAIADWATAISPGATNEGGQTLAFEIASNTNASLFSAGPAVAPDGTLTYTPAPNANGAATIGIRLSDGIDTSATQTFTITVTAVNDIPSFTKGGDESVLEDAGPRTVAGWATAISAGPSDEGGQTLAFEIASNTNASLFSAGPAVAANGTLTYTPAPNANGSATVGVRLADDGGGAATSATQTFTITVTPVNDAPSFTAGGDQGSPEDAGPQTVPAWATAISPGALDEGGQALAFEITGNSNPSLFSVAPAIAANGTLTYQPARNTPGIATIEVRLTDDGGTASGGENASDPATFTITVEGANDPPIAANDIATVRIGGGTAIDVRANDSGGPNEAGDPTTITAVREGSRGIVTITGGGTGVSYDPIGCSTGTDTFSYTLTDGGGSTDTATVLVTIASPTTYPVADGPRPGFTTGKKMGSSVPVTMSWCGLTSGTTIKAYRLRQSTNGGAWTTVVSSTTATSSTRNLGVSPTSYQFEARVKDNKSRLGYGYGPRFRVVRTQDSSASISYSSGWRVSSASGNSGGTARYTSRAGKSATFTYTGRAFAIVGTKGPTRGGFNVYVDGVKVTSKAISARSATTKYRRILYWRQLPLGTHTVKVVATGSGRVDLDAIVTIATP